MTDESYAALLGLAALLVWWLYRIARERNRPLSTAEWLEEMRERGIGTK